MIRPNYKLLLANLAGMREVSAILAWNARDEALRRARTPEERETIQSRYFEEVAQTKGWFDEQAAFLQACLEVEAGTRDSIPKRTKRPSRYVTCRADYESVRPPIEIMASVLADGLPSEVEEIMLLVEGLIDAPPSPEKVLSIGQIQAMVLEMYMQTEQADREDRARFKFSAKRGQ